MKNKRIIMLIITFILLLILIILLIACFYKPKKESEYININLNSTDINIEYTNEELTGEWSKYNAKITLSDDKIAIEGNGVKNNDNILKIISAGTYYITGSISDISIQIEAGKEDDVQLVLDNCSITSTKTAPINGITCDKLTITLADDSKNILTDNSNYTIFTDTDKSEPDGTLFTKTDLVINGNGKLVVNANYKDGIVSKDSLKIINAEIEINSADDGIRGKDYIAINEAKLNINSKGDGIKSTNSEDSSLGYIAIKGGEITINSQRDGIQAKTVLNISSNTQINITTTGQIQKSSNDMNQGFEMRGGPYGNTNTQTSSTDDISSKALKAGTEITIEDGTYNIVSTDDSIHSNGIIIINNGIFNISSGDDGIHADTNIVINNGNINISKSYEGIESSYIEINNGEISIVSSDDGINVAGGNDSSAINGRPGQNNFSNIEDTNVKLVINGGIINVDATGDGLDANGSIYINGGTTTVAGPTSSGNGALDYDRECIIKGGKLIAYGSTGMWQNPSNNSEQYTVAFQNTGKSGDNIVLKDNSGNEIISIATQKSYNAIAISDSSIKKGETYTLYVNSSNVGNITVNSIVSSNFSMGGNAMQPGMQQNNGGKKKGF